MQLAGLVPVSKGFQVVVVGIGHKAASCVYAPALVTGGTGALGKVLFLDCQLEWNVPEETPKACVPFRPPSLPLCPGHIPVPATPLCGGCCHHRWGDPKEGSWRWAPQHLETWSPGSFPARAPHPLGAGGVVSVQGGPAWIWRLWAGAEGSRPPGSRGRARWLAPPPHPPQPRQSAHGTQAARASGTWWQPRSPRPEGNGVSTLFLYFVFCVGVDVTYSVVECVCFLVSGVLQRDSLARSRVHVLLWVLFSYSLPCRVEYRCCPTVGSCW